MPICSYCKKDYDLHKGLTLIQKDGSVKHLCSAKCRKNMKMKRRKVRWILKSKKDKVVFEKPVKKVEKKSVEKVPEEKIEEKTSEKKE